MKISTPFLYASVLFITLLSFQGIDLIKNLARLDQKLSEPGAGEWRSVHKEKGQTFAEYKAGSPFKPSASQKKIYIQPIGKFTPIQKKIIGYTAEYLRIFFEREVVVLKAKSDDIITETGRRGLQLHTVPVLDLMEKSLTTDALGIIAVTEKDLFPRKGWNYVFGQARLGKRVCVASLFRYSGPKMDSTNYQLCLERFIKTATHEFSHTLSLKHCIHAVCLMNGSNSQKESDARPNRLCSQCTAKLEWNLHWNLHNRITNLEKFFRKHKLDSDLKVTIADRIALSTD